MDQQRWVKSHDQFFLSSVKNELVITEGLPQTGYELAAENAAQYADERQSAGGNHTMDMGMKAESLAPSVQHAEEADSASNSPSLPFLLPTSPTIAGERANHIL